MTQAVKLLKHGRWLAAVIKSVFRRPFMAVTLIPILPDGRVVMVRRRDNGLWSLPGGLVDWGESTTEAARRELREETGLALITVERIVGVFSQPERDPRFHCVVLSLAVQATGNLIIEDTVELSSVQAFALDALPDTPFAHDHEQQLACYQQRSAPVLD